MNKVQARALLEQTFKQAGNLCLRGTACISPPQYGEVRVLLVGNGAACIHA